MLISGKGFAGRDFEQMLAGYSITLLRPSRADEQARYGEPVLKKVRQLIESVNDTLKGQLDLEGHGGRTFEGVAIRVAQRSLRRISPDLPSQVVVAERRHRRAWRKLLPGLRLEAASGDVIRRLQCSA
jgi:hypothetical protein